MFPAAALLLLQSVALVPQPSTQRVGAARPIPRPCTAVRMCVSAQSRDPIDQSEPLKWRPERADYWHAMCSAVALTDESGLQPFSNPAGWMGSMGPPPTQAYTREELAAFLDRTEPILHDLLDVVADRAPSLCNLQALLPLARLATWTDSEAWVRPLDEWPGEAATAAASGMDEDAGSGTSDDVDGNEGDDEDEGALLLGEAAALRSLSAHLLEKWDVPEVLHGALAFADGLPATEAAHRISRAFVRVHASAGRGDASVLAMLREEISPAISKAAAKHFVKAPADGGDNADGVHPLHALRRAQVLSLGGDDWVAEAACASRLGDSLLRKTDEPNDEAEGNGAATSSGPSEPYALLCLDWLVRHRTDLDAPPALGTSLVNFFLEMRDIDGGYTPVGRTPKTVNAALEAYVATTVDFGDCPDEAFEPNPRGIKPLFEMGATIPEGTRVRIPYYWGDEERGTSRLGGEFAGGTPAVVRVAEIRSLQRLFYEGEMLDNCLQGSRSSQAKYLSRARNRVSSFWSLTKQPEGSDEVEHLCLIEVWHLGQGINEIRQAEGPRPRTLPSPEAWYWMDLWCKREGIDLSTWDCYS